MIGFLTGVALNIIFGQFSDLTGAPTEGGFALAKAIDVIAHPADIDVPSLLVGLGAMAILVLLARTRLRIVSALVALVVPTIVVLVAGLDTRGPGRRRRGDPPRHPLPGDPRPRPALREPAHRCRWPSSPSSSSRAPASPSRRRTPRDGRLEPGLHRPGHRQPGRRASFGGQPVGGSVGQTALNVAAGARTPLGGDLAGIWMIVILVAFSTAVGKVAMPTLAAVLIYAAVPGRCGRTEIHTDPGAPDRTRQIAFVSTLVATLFMPVAAAVGIGVVALAAAAAQPGGDGPHGRRAGRGGRAPRRATGADRRSPATTSPCSTCTAACSTPAPARCRPGSPIPSGSVSPAVVLRLRGRTSLGSTFFVVVGDYAAARGGRRTAVPHRARTRLWSR